jgi:hypothetical protein
MSIWINQRTKKLIAAEQFNDFLLYDFLGCYRLLLLNPKEWDYWAEL